MRTKFSGILTLLLAFVVQITFAQERTISGVVTDDTGLPLPGVNVLIKDTNTGTQTDFDGNYAITANEGQTLVFSYVGFTTQERLVTTANRIDLQMDPGEALDEVVIVAYGVQQRQRVSQAVSTVSSEQIEQVPIASFDQALQGLAAGVNVQTNSGQPGRRGQVIIRGRSSINGDVNPLYVIDGVPSDAAAFRSINANDIADFSILKDAAATAPYGNRGANGVILVTTKRGNFNSPFRVTYRALHGVSNVTSPGFEVMNAQQYLGFSRDIFGGGQGVGMTDEQIAAAPNANWTDLMFQQGITTSHEVSITNGSENDRSFFSVGYFNQEGITRRSELERFTSRFNYEARKDRFDYSTNVSLNYSTSDFVVDPDRSSSVFAANTGGELDNPFIVPYIGLPHYNPWNADGSLNHYGTVQSGALNPDGSPAASGSRNGFLNTPFLALNTLHYNTDLENELKAIGNITANYRISDVFTAGARMGIDYTGRESLAIVHPFSHRGATRPNVNSEFKGEQVESYRRDFVAMFNPYIRFDTQIDRHNIRGSAHMEYNYRNLQEAGFQAFGLNPNLLGSGAGFTDGTVTEGPNDDTYYYIPNVWSTEIERSLFSVFALAEYDFDNRYGLTGSIRRDGSSRFAPDNRWGTFYSVSGRWNISNEEFLANSETVSDLRLRASYGSVGNENIGSFYEGLDRISITTGYQGAPGYIPTGLVDPNLEWETTDQANIGLDFGFMENRLTGSVDVYDKRTKNLFFLTPVSQSSGYPNVIRNQADLSNRGVELQLSYDLVRSEDFNISVFGNGAYNKNEVLGLADSDLVSSAAITATAVGQPLRSFYLVEWAGVNPANGMPLYRDADGNLTEQFSTNDRKFSGRQSDPVYTGGFGSVISYKGFQLNANFSFAADMWRSNGSLALLEDTGTAAFSNQTINMLDTWQQPGDITSIPAIAAGSLRLDQHDRYLEDASFLRLRNLTLAYNFNAQQLERSNFLTALRVYVQGTNLATWTKWRGFDPEGTSTGAFFDYPVPRQFSMGVDISF